MLTIGDFSRLTHLSVRTLRRYHDAGLLVPEVVDRSTGYRYYGAGQIPTAQVIHRLRALDVELRSVPAVTAAAVTDDVDLDGVLSWYAGAAAELEVSVAEPTGPPGGMYDDALFQTGRGRCVVYRPTAQPPRSGRVRPVTLPPAELAVTTHAGPHHDLDVTYGELGAWLVDNALRVAGPVRETYLVGPRDTVESAAWRTEIGWPVFRLAGPAGVRDA